MAVAFVARFLNKSQFIDWPPGKKNKAVERGGRLIVEDRLYLV